MLLQEGNNLLLMIVADCCGCGGAISKPKSEKVGVHRHLLHTERFVELEGWCTVEQQHALHRNRQLKVLFHCHFTHLPLAHACFAKPTHERLSSLLGTGAIFVVHGPEAQDVVACHDKGLLLRIPKGDLVKLAQARDHLLHQAGRAIITHELMPSPHLPSRDGGPVCKEQLGARGKAGLLPEETFPSGKVGSLEQSVLEDALHATKCLNDIRSVVVQVPELAIMSLVGPPERVLSRDLELLEVRSYPPALVIGQCVPILLEQSVDPGDTPVPAVLQVFQSKAPVLRHCLLSLERILRPNPLGVCELAQPGLNVPVQVGDELLLLRGHSRTEVGHPKVSLLCIPQVRLRYQDVAHAKHPKATDLLWRVENNRRKSARHLGVEAYLDPCLNLVLALHQEIKKLLCVYDSLAVVRHQANQSSVPLVRNLREGGGTRGHENLPDSVFKCLHGLVVHSQESLRSPLLCHLICEAPHPLFRSKPLLGHPAAWQDPHLKARHVEQEVWVVLAVHTDKAVLPLKSSHAPWQPVLHIPEHSPAKVHIVLHKSHSGIPWPALLVVVAHYILVVWVWVLREVPLDKILGLLRFKFEQHVNLVDIPAVQPDGVLALSLDILEAQKVIGMVGRSSNLARPRQSQEQQVHNETVVLGDEGAELQTPDKPVRICV